MKLFNRIATMLAEVTGAVALMGATALVAPPVHAQNTAPIRIGSTLALTGPLSATAMTHKLVGDIYVEQLNARGGLLGRKVNGL